MGKVHRPQKVLAFIESAGVHGFLTAARQPPPGLGDTVDAITVAPHFIQLTSTSAGKACIHPHSGNGKDDYDTCAIGSPAQRRLAALPNTRRHQRQITVASRPEKAVAGDLAQQHQSSAA